MKRILNIAILSALMAPGLAQDPQFSQFYAAPLYLGPSMAGTTGNTRVGINFRDQWPKISGKYITYSLSLDGYLEKYNSGLGLLVLHDNAGGGKLTTTQAGFNYAYRIKVNRDFFIQPGIQFQYYQRRINFNKLTFADQYFEDEVLPGTVESPPDNQAGHIDFTSSMLAFTKKFWLGVTVDHLMKLNQTLKQDDRYVPLKLSAHGGYKIDLNQSSLLRGNEESITAAFHYRSQASMQQLDIGMYYSNLPFMVGIWYRGIPVIQSTKTKDAITLSGGVLIRQLTFTYSYDLTVSSLIASTGGAHEIALVYVFDRPEGRNRRKMEAVPCPKF
jgi:type IX secretion system PorP/SprF family membrane protein